MLIIAAADSKALSPIRNIGEQLVVLKHLFDDFEENINWEEDDEDDDDANGTVARSDSSRDQFSDGHALVDEEEVHKRQLSQPSLFTISHYRGLVENSRHKTLDI
jgi:hypothetical protein